MSSKIDAAIELIVDASNYVTGESVTLKNVKSKSRRAFIVDTRHVVCYLLKTHSDMTLATIGGWVNRDHATALHSINKVKDSIGAEKHFFQAILNKCEDDVAIEINSYFAAEAMSRKTLIDQLRAEIAEAKKVVQIADDVLLQVKEMVNKDKVMEGWRCVRLNAVIDVGRVKINSGGL